MNKHVEAMILKISVLAVLALVYGAAPVAILDDVTNLSFSRSRVVVLVSGFGREFFLCELMFFDSLKSWEITIMNSEIGHNSPLIQL